MPNRSASSAASGRAGDGLAVAVRLAAELTGAELLDGAELTDGAESVAGAGLVGVAELLTCDPAAPERAFDPDALAQPVLSRTAAIASALSRPVRIWGFLRMRSRPALVDPVA